jgi:hypothetical protein
MDAIRTLIARYVAGKTSVVDPDSDLYLMRIRMQLFTLMRIRIQILASKKRLKPSKKC